jgi:glycosyltransferase involved in cell wall biosynthesis
MKVLWIINDSLDNKTKSIGWVQGYLNEHYKINKFNLYVLFPSSNFKKTKPFHYNNVIFIPFYKPPLIPFTSIQRFKSGYFSKVILRSKIHRINADLLHIFGSEFEHSYSAALYFNKPNKTILHLQGLTSEYYKYYDFKVPFLFKILMLPNDIFKGNILFQKHNFFLRGKNEFKLIKFIGHVSGRTNWDYSVVKKINPKINYFLVNESLRETFYKPFEKIKKYDDFTVFINQATYPIKGIHTIIKDLAFIKSKYSINFNINVAGKRLFYNSFFRNMVFLSSYGLYVYFLTKKYNIKLNFIGRVNSSDIRRELLKSSLFISCSVIENSSNAIGEAMILGIPILASCVGGTPSIIQHNKNGFLYSLEKQNDFIEKFIFVYNKIRKNKFTDLRINIIPLQKKHADNLYNKEKNFLELINMYDKVFKS